MTLYFVGGSVAVEEEACFALNRLLDGCGGVQRSLPHHRSIPARSGLFILGICFPDLDLNVCVCVCVSVSVCACMYACMRVCVLVCVCVCVCVCVWAVCV